MEHIVFLTGRLAEPALRRVLDQLVADEAWIPQGGTVVRTREIPLENAVVRFP